MGDNRSEIIILKIARGVRVSLDKELMLHITIGISWASLLLFYARGVILKLPVLKDYVDEVNVALVVIPVILSLRTLISKFSVFDFLFYILNVLYILSCYVFFPENSSYLDENALTWPEDAGWEEEAEASAEMTEETVESEETAADE